MTDKLLHMYHARIERDRGPSWKNQTSYFHCKFTENMPQTPHPSWKTKLSLVPLGNFSGPPMSADKEKFCTVLHTGVWLVRTVITPIEVLIVLFINTKHDKNHDLKLVCGDNSVYIGSTMAMVKRRLYTYNSKQENEEHILKTKQK